MFTEWNWTEVSEGFVTGVVVTVLFALLPIRKRMKKHHAESMDMHRKTHDHLGVK